MADSYQHEIPKARVNISLDLHTGGARKRVELPLKLLVMGDYSAGRDDAPVSDRKKIAIDKTNFDAVLAELNPQVVVAAPNTIAGDGSDLNVRLDIRSMKDFEPEQVARQLPELRALMAMRNLLRDLKANLLDDAAFRRELERIVKDPSLSSELGDELAKIADIAA